MARPLRWDTARMAIQKGPNCEWSMEQYQWPVCEANASLTRSRWSWSASTIVSEMARRIRFSPVQRFSPRLSAGRIQGAELIQGELLTPRKKRRALALGM